MSSNEDLTQAVTLEMSLGHVIVMWEVLANKLSTSALSSALRPEELRSLRAAQDLFERSIAAHGITPRPQMEWDQLVSSACEHVARLPIEYEDSWPVL
jgi:hypothetical protein